MVDSFTEINRSSSNRKIMKAFKFVLKEDIISNILCIFSARFSFSHSDISMESVMSGIICPWCSLMSDVRGSLNIIGDDFVTATYTCFSRWPFPRSQSAYKTEYFTTTGDKFPSFVKGLFFFYRKFALTWNLIGQEEKKNFLDYKL